MLRLLWECTNRDMIVRTTEEFRDNIHGFEPGMISTHAQQDICESIKTPTQEFDRLLELLEHPVLPPLPEDLTLETLETHGRATNRPEVYVVSCISLSDSRYSSLAIVGLRWSRSRST